MATASARTTDIKKLSFAKVAASATKDSVPITTGPRGPATPAGLRDRRDHSKAASRPAIAMGSVAMHNGAPGGSLDTARKAETPDENKILAGLTDLKLETKAPSLVVNGTGSASTERSSKLATSQTPSDEVSQRADSNSELGTKPPSLDDKSITSGTTFALDEKESLRPDDSASVKAAAEDDDSFSVRGSLIGNSRMGSEVAPRVHRLQIGDMPPRTIPQILPESQLQDAVTPQSGSSEQQPVPDSVMPLSTATSTPNGSGLYRQTPDEKLLEAMQTPKDRLFLLRLEKEVIDFVQDSKEPFMDLPPSNSFCRMLTHKLADYYHMTHSFEAVAGSVRIYRTPFCRIPVPLSTIAPATASNSGTPPPALLPKKIMRRGEDGELAPVSAGPSKPTSEVGSEAKDKAIPAKEKLSREEREEAYNKARERIFGSAGTTEANTPENEDSTAVSRASSVSARDKAAFGKRGKTGKQRRDDAESFDDRSKYTAYYHPQHTTWVQPQYVPVGTASFGAQQMPQQPYPGAIQPVYAASNPPYQQLMPTNGYAPQVNSIPQYPSQPAQPRFQAPANGPGLGPYSAAPGPAPPAPPTVPQQGWQQPAFNQSPYQSRANPAQVGIPYAYGQLPVNVNPNDPKSQHPIPGSYAGNFHRHGFNPKTQSFVPATGMPPPPPIQTAPTGPYPAAAMGPMHGAAVNQPQMPFNGYQQPMPHPQPYAAAHGSDYSMMRQGSNNSIPPYPPAHPPVYPPGPAQSHPHPHQHLPPNPPPHLPNKPAMPQGAPPMVSGCVGGHGGGGSNGGQPFSRLPNYGNPATLPQKPST